MNLQPGKLPSALLAELLATISHQDPRVIIGPGVGRDAAVIDLGGRMLVAKTDPITFATDHIGWYAVNVNANDIACMGARPAWMLATVLLPPGAPDALARRIFADLNDACATLDIELVGGHCEITMGIDRPIVVGAMLGEADPEQIVTGENIVPGDRVLLTKGIAIEGTAVLARESADDLAARGVDSTTIGRCASILFDPGVSVVADAVAVCAATRPRLLHDATEGGVSTALYEMAEAAGATLRIAPGGIRLLDETERVCAALGLDPMGLLASGALLAIVPADDAPKVVARLDAMKILCDVVGEVEAGPPRVIIGAEDRASPFPRFARDELARYYDDAKGRAAARGEPSEG
jgi:hydrogenase maturation factor